VGVGLGKSEYDYTNREDEIASRRIYSVMDRLSKMGFEGTPYIISGKDGSVQGIL